MTKAERAEDALKAVDDYLKVIGNSGYPGESVHVECLAVAARICSSSGEPAKGLKLAERALKAGEALQPANHHVTGMAHVSAAVCQIAMKDGGKARIHADRAWESLGKLRYQDKVPNLIPRCHSMVRIGSAFNATGDSLMAEKYYRLAVKDGRTLMSFELYGASYDLGKFMAAGRAFSTLGGFYTQSGDYRRAIPLTLQSLEIRKKAGPSGPGDAFDLEASYISLSRAYLGVGEVEKARQYSNVAINLALRSTIPLRLPVAKSTLVSAFGFEGEYDKALEVTGEVQELLRSVRNDRNFESPALMSNAGFLLLMKGESAQAKKILTKAYLAMQKDSSSDPEDVANVVFSLAMVEFLEGDPDRGLKGLKKAHSIYEEVVEQKLDFGSASQKLAFLQKLRAKTDFVLGMAFGKYRDHQELAREAWLTVIRRKGRMTRLLRESAALLNRSEVPREQREQLVEARSKLSLLGLSLGIFDREGAGEFDQDWMIEIEEAERSIQEVLRKSAGELGTRRDVSVEKLAGALEEGEVLLEYVVYRPFRRDVPKSRTSSIPLRCGVFVMDAKGMIKVADLGEYPEIQGMAIAFRKSLSNPNDEGYTALGSGLYQKLIGPIEELVEKADRLRIAPDGQLNVLPFEALLTGEGSFLGSRCQMSYLLNGGELLVPVAPVKDAGQLKIFAGPEYSRGLIRKAATSEAEGFEPRLSKFWEDISSIGAPLQFQPLPGTVEEAKSISKSMPGAVVVQGEEATEEAFVRSGGGGILHIATHGFYLNDSLLSSNEKRGLKRVKPGPPLGLETVEEKEQGNWIGQRSLDHPLLNCGLVFSGANQLFDGKNDGVVTGMEVLNLDLRGTDLVVLSACETGVGEVIAGEGVLGLNQAFRVAGASSLVTSLWKVSDEATATLMAGFYSGLSKGLTKREALQKASKAIRETEKWSHPSYWSAFVLSGEAGALAK